MDRFAFPAFTSVWVVLSIFAAEVVLSPTLIFWLKIGKRAWKIVDYIWLSRAALGIFGAPGQARQLVATNTVASSSQRTQISYMQLLSFGGAASRFPFAAVAILRDRTPITKVTGELRLG